MKPRILVINGSLGGHAGNTGAILDKLVNELKPHADVSVMALTEGFDPVTVTSQLEASDGFVFATGVYWDSWGSPLQRFLEEMTDTEAGTAWLGKPAAVLVTEHSVGGKSVLSRLQGVLGTLGCFIPPMSGLVLSMASYLALRGPATEFRDDLWQVDDFKIIVQNLLEACSIGQRKWKPWPVDVQDPRRRWFFN